MMIDDDWRLLVVHSLCEWKKRAMPRVPRFPSPYSSPTQQATTDSFTPTGTGTVLIKTAMHTGLVIRQNVDIS